jgi:hypothetical protein
MLLDNIQEECDCSCGSECQHDHCCHEHCSCEEIKCNAPISGEQSEIPVMEWDLENLNDWD